MKKPAVSPETWKKRIDASRRRRARFEDIWSEYARLHTNAYLAVREQNDDQLVHLPSGDQVKVGLVHRSIEQTMALLEVPEIGVRAEAGDYHRELAREDTHRESVVEAGLVRSLRCSGLLHRDEEVDYIKRDGTIIGHGINYSWWRIVEREVPLPPMPVLEEAEDGSFQPMLDKHGAPVLEERTERRVIWEGVQDEHCSPLEFLFDAASTTIRKAPWHGMEKVCKLESLKDDPRFEVPGWIEATSFTVRDLYGETPTEEAVHEDSVRLIVIWDKERYELLHFIETRPREERRPRPPAGEKGARPRRPRRDQQELSLVPIAVTQWPVIFSHPDDSPFSVFIPIPANDHPFGVSQIEHIKNPAVEADKLRTRQANLTRQIKRIIWYRKNRLDPDQLTAALRSPDVTPVGLDFNDAEKLRPEDLFGELPLPGIDPDLLAQQAAAEEDVRKTTGVSEIPFGGASTATESDNLMAIGAARPNRKRRLYLAFLTEVAYRHLDFLREFAPEGDMVQVYGADGQPLALPYGREALQGKFLLEVQPGGGATAVSPVKQKMMLELGGMLMGRFSPTFDRIFARQILTLFDARDINAMLEAIPITGYMSGGAGGGLDGRFLEDRVNPNALTPGQVLREAVNSPNEGHLL